MSTETTRLLRDAPGRELVDESGNKIGAIETIYTDTDTGRPEWFAVKTGLFGRRLSFVPMSRAYFDSEDHVVVPYDKGEVKDAPHVDPDGELSHDEEAQLYDYYGVSFGRSRSETQLPESASQSRGDTAMTRSEEELVAEKQTQAAGKARLKKWIETEHQTVTIPVRRERAKVVTEPITDANRDEAMDGPDITAGEHEETLYEEEPVVGKRTVPKERVRLEKESVTDDREVGADLRKERIETEGDVEHEHRR